MSYGRIRQCLTSEMGRYYAIQRTVRALLMLQFTPSYVVPSQSIALRIRGISRLSPLDFHSNTSPARFA